MRCFMCSRRPYFRLITVLLCSLLPGSASAVEAISLKSPDGQIRLEVKLDDSSPFCQVSYGKNLIVSCKFGLSFLDMDDLRGQLKISTVKRDSHDDTYAIPVGKTSTARSHYQELIVSLEETTKSPRKMDLVFRAFDDGIAFRYVIP